MEQEKNTSSRLPLYLSIAALVLSAFMLVFSFVKHGNMADNDSESFVASPKNGHSIAYINTDSILRNYELVKELGNKLEDKSIQYEKEISNKQAEFEKEAAYFQESVKKNALSENSAKEIYQKLMEKQQSILELKDYYSRQLAIEEGRINELLVDTVSQFLKRFNKGIHFDYILGFNKNGNIFLANDTFDITKQVLAELNRQYLLNNPVPKKK